MAAFRPSRRALIVGALLTLLPIAYGGYGYYQMWRAGREVLPEFSDPAPGPRAPTAQAFGFALGTASVGDAERVLAQHGLTCKDTSARALMAAMRDERLREIDAQRAQGADVDADALSGASWLKHKTARERNPQVRLACADAPASALGDRRRPPATGRLLLVFDSANHPLRHVSYQRSYADPRLALLDLRQTVEVLTRALGEPSSRSGKLPDDAAFPVMEQLTVEWKFSDVHAKVSALNFGKQVMVDELVEVPWPIRPDAPALPR